MSTSTSGVRPKRRRRITEDQRIVVRRSSDIVTKLLNSPDGLLAICLREGRLGEASKVVKVSILICNFKEFISIIKASEVLQARVKYVFVRHLKY